MSVATTKWDKKNSNSLSALDCWYLDFFLLYMCSCKNEGSLLPVMDLRRLWMEKYALARFFIYL